MPTKSLRSVLFVLLVFFDVTSAAAQTVDMVGPEGSSGYGYNVVLLPNGNYVVTDPFFGEGGVSFMGAVYLYKGGANTLISTFKGSQANDQIGLSAGYQSSIVVLANGNFVVSSPNWHNKMGAVTWFNGNTGLSDTVSATNSLVGNLPGDAVGFGQIAVLPNGSYVVPSPKWNNNMGAVTWCNGTSGFNGTITASNSLVGSHANDYVGNVGDYVSEGINIAVLANGNYVVNSPDWNGMGAVTWGSGISGIIGTVDSTNSLIGSSPIEIIPLPNGNYIFSDPYWNNYCGAATWGNGLTGTSGVVSANNSLVGSNPYVSSNPYSGDAIGDYGNTGLKILSNGNYLVASPYWNSTRGAVTWGNGKTGVSGIVSSSNSLVGSTPSSYGYNGDGIGGRIAILTNGNFVIGSYSWNGSRGSATWGDGATGISGVVSISNSLVGSSVGDQVGAEQGNIVALTNGNYVVTSPGWNQARGAATWCNGSTGLVGLVTFSNSLTGRVSPDQIAKTITPLSNGNYVIGSMYWGSNYVGAATWCNGSTGTTGMVTSSNSLIGTNNNDYVGTYITALNNGNYVVGSKYWNGNIGASTWCTGTSSTSGTVSLANSITGSIAKDYVGTFVTGLPNGNYIVGSPSWNGNKGAATWGNGSAKTTGVVSASNSLIGNTSSPNFSFFDTDGVIPLKRQYYIVKGVYWNNYKGEITWGNAQGGTVGVPKSCNSIFGLGANGGYRMPFAYDSINNYFLMGRVADNIVSRYYPALGAAIPSNNDNSSTTISGNTPFIFPTNTGCGQIAALTPSGTSPVTGSVTAKTWIESPQPTYFLARHFELTPTTNPTTATGTVTLYFAQADFDGFNNQSVAPASKLPTGPTDAVGISHLLVQKEGGVSNVGTGLPGTYPGTVTTINPDDANIVWNTALQRWEVTFDVTGFSGFFIKTASATVVLPLQLLNFSGNHNGNSNVLQWTTTDEVGTKTFVVESSANGNNFTLIGNVVAAGDNKYSFVDNNPFPTRTYYRLKIIDTDGKFTYSNIIWISTIGNSNISVYPNPVVQTTTLNINNNSQLIGTTAQLTDAGGRLLQQISINHDQEQLNMGALPTGLYLLKLKDGTVLKVMKDK